MINKDKFITIKGAKVHNLKNIDLKIPRNKFIVITGLSGSGKSSLAFDTLYAEGQRRYVESLSSYARQFLGRINKPEVDFIKGIPPAIAIEQKVNTRNPRSTVGTSTEIYDYLKLLFARVGKTYSPISNILVKRHSVSDVVNFSLKQEIDATVMIMAELHPNVERSRKEQLEILSQQGFSRIEIDGKAHKIFDVLEDPKLLAREGDIHIIVDRLRVDEEDDTKTRLADSIQTAFYEGKGECLISISDSKALNYHSFSNRFEADGITFEDPNTHTFSFNNPVGACPKCEGFGKVIGIDEDLVIPNKTMSIYEDAVVCWKGEKMSKWKDELVFAADKFDFPIHKPFFELSEEHRQLLWTGNKHFKGLNAFFAYIESKQYKIQYRVMLSRYRGKTTCPDCRGTRLKKEAGYIKITGKNIQDLVLMPISDLNEFFNNLKLEGSDEKVAKRILIEIQNRLQFLSDVGLGYLTLNRLSSSLSGGESQRINLATSLGSSLVGSLYILDEPSIGLHSKDTELLIKVLRQLRDLGNTVVVVEHDEDIIMAADQVIDIGPYAGRLGGELVFQGDLEQLKNSDVSLTSQYISKTRSIPTPDSRRKWNNYIEILGARENNLKSLDIKFPLNTMTLVTGVSGSGKSSLIKTILYPALKKHYGGYSDKSGHFDALKGDLHMISNVEFVDQNPIGKSSRSNPVTYLKAYDEIRKLYAEQQASKYGGYKAAHFSFNIDGGRCDECQGEGIIKVEMQFMADVYLQCESCKGRRFKDDILDVKFREKNIHDILEMTVNEATEFFMESTGKTEKKIAQRLKPLVDVGLGYVKLGQASSTLSGGESQRVKLASFLAKEKAEPCLFIFDEPTTGLHFHDINKLMDAFNALIARGHSLIVIEHNMEVIKCADWIIDLGPDGGNNGGALCFEGLPEDIIKEGDSFTGEYLKEKL